MAAAAGAVLRPAVPSWSGASSAVSAWRTSPTLSQVVVVQKAQLDPHAYARLESLPDPDRRRLPLGPPSDQDAREGELAFSEALAPGTFQPSVPGDITLTVFTPFNGRDASREALRFQGVITKPVQTGKGKVLDLTIKVSGTETIVNTGPDIITEGSLVYWDTPLTLKDSTGRTTPGFQAYGVSSSKFLPALYPLHIGNLHATWQRFLRETWDAIRAAGPQGQPAVLAAAQRVGDRFAVLHTRPGDAERDPFRRAARAMARLVADNTQLWLPPADNAPVLMHQEALRHSAYLAGRASALPTAETLRALDLDQTEAHGTCLLYLATCQMDYVELMRSRVIGRALSSAARGGQFDILLNARW